MSYQPIENYGIIGDLHTVALVGINGSVDFMCYPHFDSPTIFAALLDHHRGGSFQIAPLHDGVRHKQMYLPDTNMLLTRFLSREGVAELSDFMPVKERGHVHRLVRRIKTVKGRFKYRLLCDPRFDYGRSQHRIEVRENGVLFTQDEERTFFLRSPIPIEIKDGAALAEFTLADGQSAAFVFEEYGDGGISESENLHYVSTAFKETLNHLEGYRGSSSIRIGNGAYDQLQLDIYGELLDSIYLYNKYGEPISFDLWQNVIRLVDWVTKNWQRPDEGVWEVRGGRQEFLYSRVMPWVAVDRAVRLATKRSFPAPLDHWIKVRDQIY